MIGVGNKCTNQPQRHYIYIFLYINTIKYKHTCLSYVEKPIEQKIVRLVTFRLKSSNVVSDGESNTRRRDSKPHQRGQRLRLTALPRFAAPPSTAGWRATLSCWGLSRSPFYFAPPLFFFTFLWFNNCTLLFNSQKVHRGKNVVSVLEQ